MRPIACLLLVGLVACSNDRAPDAAEAPAPIRGTVDLEIGDVTGEDPYLFASISGVVVDSAGRLYVTDSQADEIRVFRPDGTFSHRIGGSGEGPGELGGACCPRFSPDGRLWVRDAGNARYNSYELAMAGAEYAGSIPIRHPAAGLWSTTSFDVEGRLVDVGVPMERGPTEALARYHRAPDGSIVATTEIAVPPPREIGMYTVERATPNGAVTWYIYQPFGPRHLVAHGPGGRWAEAVSSRYRIVVHAGGEPVVIEGPDVRGPELSLEEQERGAAAMTADRERLDLGAGDMPSDLPERKPPLRDMYFGTDGRLWVELNVEGDERAADVYGSAGGLMARYHWPARVAIGVAGWVGATSIVGVTRDSLGVQRLARVTFDP